MTMTMTIQEQENMTMTMTIQEQENMTMTMTIQEQVLVDLLDAIPNRMDCLQPSHKYQFYFEWETGSVGLSREQKRWDYNSTEAITTLTFKVKGQEAPLIFSRDVRVDCMYDTLQNLIETKQFAPHTMSVKDFARR